MNGLLRIPPRPGKPVEQKARPEPRRFSWLSALFLSLVAAILFLPELHSVHRQGGRRFQSEQVGYVVATRALADQGVLSLVEDQSRADMRRSVITVDPIAFRKAMGGNCELKKSWMAVVGAGLKSLIKGSDGARTEDPCMALDKAYRKSTFLGDDMAWASPAIWEFHQPGEETAPDGTTPENRNPIRGVKANARGLIESGFVTSQSSLKLRYADQPEGRCNWQLRQWTGDLATVDQLSEAVGPDCPGTTDNIGRAAQFNRPCFDEALLGATINCFAEFALLSVPAGTSDITVGGVKAVAGQHYLLRAGDVIGLGRGNQVLQLLHRRGMSERAPSGSRVRDLAYAGLTAQIDMYEDSPDLTSSVHLLWDRKLQQVLQGQMGDAAQVGQSRTLRGAMLMMDGLTGEITATATFPRRAEQLAQGDAAIRRDWLERNFAFETLPPGSAAKVPFAAAILMARPDLANFTTVFKETHCVDYKSFKNGIDYVLANKCHEWRDHGYNPPHEELPGIAPRLIGIERFIAHSNNYYAFSLVREARRPLLSGLQPTVPWENHLRNLACAWPLTNDGAEVSTTDCPIRFWRDSRSEAASRSHAGLQVPGPEVWDKELADSIFLGVVGNGNYNWTAVQLAQAYARVISGRNVTPRLLQGGTQPVAHMDGDQWFKDPVWKANWRRIMAGMAGVIDVGTAKDVFRPGELPPNIALFGKTGTPTLEHKVQGRTVYTYGKVFVLAVVRTRNGPQTRDIGRPNPVPASPEDICGLKLIVFNAEMKGNGNDNIGAVAANRLMAEPAIRDWLTQPCQENSR